MEENLDSSHIVFNMTLSHPWTHHYAELDLSFTLMLHLDFTLASLET